MAHSNLRAVFAAGLAPNLSAQDVFTDRVSELEAFRAALDAMFPVEVSTRSLPAILDHGQPRRNLLVYHGAGGIGKTRLSEVLEQRLTEWHLLGPAPDRAAIRLDFGEASAFDLESVVLRIRAGLGQLGKGWTAFDLAFAVYWQKAHPGEPLREFVDRHVGLRHLASRVGLEDQIIETIAQFGWTVGPAVGLVSQGGRAVQALYGSVRRAIAHNRLLKECPYFEPLIEADPDEDCLSYLPSLLGWDLEHLGPTRRVVVVFLDTFESITARPTREFERYLQRIVFLMPNVLFVVTGRHRLDWAELPSPSELDYTGRRLWPNLHVDNRDREPRQHLVGYLPPEDCDDYLVSAVSSDDRPALSAAIRERIVAGSGGIPLYLDLSVGQPSRISMFTARTAARRLLCRA